jgi:recombination protein RecR
LPEGISKLPIALEQLLFELQKLPTIGQKSAQRLAFHLLQRREKDARSLSAALIRVAEEIRSCKRCFYLAEDTLCPICKDAEIGRRDATSLCVVEQPLDVLAIERTGAFRGVYHILEGALSPLKGINTEDIRIAELLRRLGEEAISEVILATNPNVEGEATGMYLARLIQKQGTKVSRLAYGLPMGTHLEYTDAVTLARALSGRSSL